MMVAGTCAVVDGSRRECLASDDWVRVEDGWEAVGEEDKAGGGLG